MLKHYTDINNKNNIQTFKLEINCCIIINVDNFICNYDFTVNFEDVNDNKLLQAVIEKELKLIKMI